MVDRASLTTRAICESTFTTMTVSYPPPPDLYRTNEILKGSAKRGHHTTRLALQTTASWKRVQLDLAQAVL